MGIKYNRDLVKNARELRKNMTAGSSISDITLYKEKSRADARLFLCSLIIGFFHAY
jgi:hypothetical protein